MPTERGWHSANVLDGKIYIIGGCKSSIGPSGDPAILAVDVYDPATDSWTQKGNIPRKIAAGSTSVANKKIYAYGGYGGLDEVHEYNPITDTWTSKTAMPTKRCDFSGSVVDGKIYAIGGHPGLSPYQALATVEVYNPSKDSWETASDMLTGRCGVSTSVVDGKIYAFGGYTGTWIGPICVTVEEYDPSNELTDVERIDSKLPKQFELNQNYPNPFNPSTKISYLIPNSGFVILKVYDMLGREIQTLVSKFQNANTYSVNFDASMLASGIYLYKLQTDDGYSEMKKMILIK